MSLVISVVRSDPCSDPLLAFQSPEEKQALRLFKNGAILHVRQGPALPTCWLEHRGDTYQFKPQSAGGRALRNLGRQSDTKPPLGDKALTDVECWVFAPEKLATLSKRWHRAQNCAKDWQKHRGPLSTNISGLSEKALATLRYLKRQYAMCMHPELLDVWLELNARGFVDVNANGGVQLRPNAEDVTVPWGSILRLKPVSSAEDLAGMAHPTGAIPPLLLEVASPLSCVDSLAPFRNGEGNKILELFKSGAVLRVYRGETSPEWTLKHKDGRKHHFARDIGTAHALVSLASRLSRGGRVPYSPSGIHNDGGKPMEETWEFNAQKLSILSLEWASAKECAADWNLSAGTFNENTQDLSLLAHATLRALQQKYTLPMHPELFEVWRELNAKGYLEVFPEGYAQLVPAARNVAVAPGPRLALRYPSLGRPRLEGVPHG
jgi:hypothetical protein